MLGFSPLAFRPSRWGLSILAALIFSSLTLTECLVHATAAHKHASATRMHKRNHSHPQRTASQRRIGVVFPTLRDGYGASAASASPRRQLGSAPSAQVAVVQQQAAISPKDAKSGLGPAKRPRKGPPTDREILDEAQAAYVRGERQRAIDIALGIAEKNGDTAPAAWRFIGLAACSVRSQRLATRAYQNLPAANDQRVIMDACRHNGMPYRDDRFISE